MLAVNSTSVGITGPCRAFSPVFAVVHTNLKLPVKAFVGTFDAFHFKNLKPAEALGTLCDITKGQISDLSTLDSATLSFKLNNKSTLFEFLNHLLFNPVGL